MGNKGRTHNFHKDAIVKTVGEALTSTKNRENSHVNNLSVCDTDKNEFRNRGKETMQSEINTEKSFSEQESNKNSEREFKAKSEEITSNANLDSIEWQPVRGKNKKRKNERHVETREIKSSTQKMTNERLETSERCPVQSSTQQPILNKTLEKKSQSSVQSKSIKADRVKNKMDSTHKNSKNSLSNVYESVNQNYKKYVKKPVQKTLDDSIAKLNSRESIQIQEKQSENFVLNSNMPPKQNKNDLQSNPLISKKRAVSGKKCCKIFKDEIICRKHFHEDFQETPRNRNQCNNKNTTECLKEQVSKDSKANLGSEEKVNDEMKDICDEYRNAQNRSQLNDANIREDLEHEMPYHTRENGYFPSHAVGIFRLYPYMPNSPFGQYLDLISCPNISYYMWHAKLFNEIHRNNFQNNRNHGLDGERNSNAPMSNSTNLNYDYPMPDVASWLKDGTVYYWYNKDFLPNVGTYFVSAYQCRSL